MRTQIQAPVKQARQQAQPPARLSAAPRVVRDDQAPQTAQLKALHATMNASPQQQRLQAIQAKVHDGAYVQRMRVLQACMMAGGSAQAISEDETAQREVRPEAATPNRTGLPSQLKAGIEALSGMRMDHVKVHYHSGKPAQLQARAYAQGSEIHLASGQEQHLPHEAWHVVQQARGMVQPTVQMKGGVPVNDDAGLEAEADRMGMQALQLGSRLPIQRAAAAPEVPRGRAVAQLFVAPVPGANEDSSYAWIVENPYSLLGGTYGNMNWIPTALTGYQTIAAAQGVVEEDDEVANLNTLEGRLDALVTTGNQTIAAFNLAGFDARLPLAATLVQVRQGVQAVVNELNFYFRPGGGGFGAVGRATEVEDREVADGARDGGPGAADRFIADTTLNGVAMTATHHVTGGADAEHVAGPINILVAGSNNPDQIEDNRDEVRAELDQIAAPALQEKAAAGNFVARDRGDGQAAAMAATNARGYAWFYDIDGWDRTRWEWLHLRGAGLGGATAGTNLVLGTRDANTQMMPYESNMRALQTAARDSGNYTGVQASWQAVGEVQRHAYDDIQMRWSAPRTQQGVDAQAPAISGEVDIHPLAVGTVLSKAEVRHIEQALTAVRQTLNPGAGAMDLED